jgi:hypothetical protein
LSKLQVVINGKQNCLIGKTNSKISTNRSIVTVNIVNSGHTRSFSSARPACAQGDADGGWSRLLMIHETS